MPPESPQRPDWTFASGRVAALEAQMAPASLFERMIEAPGIEEVMARVGESLLGDRLGRGADLQDVDVTTRSFYLNMMEGIRDICPAPDVADLLLMQHELRSLKNTIKRNHMGMEVSAPASRYGEETWDRLWNDLETELPELFGLVVDRVRGAGTQQPAVLFDAAFDSACLSSLAAVANGTGNEFVADYWRRYDTVRAAEFLWRARASGLDERVQDLLSDGRCEAGLFTDLRRAELADWPGMLAAALDGLRAGPITTAAQPEQLREFAREADRWLMDFVGGGKFVPFGPERVFGCLVGLEAEAHNMALVVAGRGNDIEPGHLRRSLRACYV